MSKTGVAQYSRRVAGASAQGWFEASELRRLVPLFALAVALVAVGTEPSSSSGDLVLVATTGRRLRPVGLPARSAPPCARPRRHRPGGRRTAIRRARAASLRAVRPCLRRCPLVAVADDGNSAGIAHGGHTRGGGCGPGPGRDRRPQLDHGHHLPLGRRPRLRAPRAGGGRARRDAARAGRAGAARRAAADRARRPRLRGAWAGRCDAPGDERTPCPAPRSRRGRGRAAFGRGGGPSQHAGASSHVDTAPSRRREGRGTAASDRGRDPGAGRSGTGRRSRGRAPHGRRPLSDPARCRARGLPDRAGSACQCGSPRAACSRPSSGSS